jgi:hypothetical protein
MTTLELALISLLNQFDSKSPPKHIIQNRTINLIAIPTRDKYANFHLVPMHRVQGSLFPAFAIVALKEHVMSLRNGTNFGLGFK